MTALRGNAGFSLIEVVFAAFIGSVGALAVAAMMVQTIRYNASGNQTSVALGLASEKLDQLVANPATAATTGEDWPPSRHGTYYRQWAIVRAGLNDRGGVNAVSDAVLHIVVRVFWPRTDQRSLQSTDTYCKDAATQPECAVVRLGSFRAP